MKTLVIFRKFNDGDIIAIFPKENYFSHESTTKMSYMHIGQYSACELDVIMNNTTKATEDEYSELKIELESLVGYNLKILKSYTYPYDSSIKL